MLPQNVNTTPTKKNYNATNVKRRLNQSNFNFSEALGSGENIRFSKADGTHLYYQIERWDSLSGEAQVWVRVDTVYGNNSTQYIYALGKV